MKGISMKFYIFAFLLALLVGYKHTPIPIAPPIYSHLDVTKAK